MKYGKKRNRMKCMSRRNHMNRKNKKKRNKRRRWKRNKRNRTKKKRKIRRLICNRRKYDHVTPLLRDVVHWLPVPFRIDYKLCLLVFQSLHGAVPEYLRDCCIGTHSSASGLRVKRSLKKTYLRVRRMRTHFGDSAFYAAGPRCWNSLPPAIRLADSVYSFKVQLKTYLFAKAYPVYLLVRRPSSGVAALLCHINCRNFYYYYYYYYR